MIEPLRLSFDLACAPEHAFEVWTKRIGTWWPKSHTTSGDPDCTVHLEPGVGGRIYERATDGREINWGEVTAWEPPRRLAYLWHIATDRSRATDVEVVFRAAGSGKTTVEIVHGGWERLGDDGPAWRDRNRGGWGGMLPHFIRAASPAGAGEVKVVFAEAV